MRSSLARLVLLLITAAALLPAAPPKGHLLIIGGGEKLPYIMKRFTDLAGGPGSKIVVFPMASSYEENAGTEDVKRMKEQGVENSFYMNITRAQADDPEMVQKLDGVTGVFFSGGDQVKLAEAMLGTKMLDRVRAIHAAGGVVGGTSAGASVMSRTMVTGNELIMKDSTQIFFTITKGNVETKEGFGFVTKAIIDQHFVVRKRHNRLISMVLERPHLLGIGIDEETCIIVDPKERFEVLGDGLVLVYDASRATGITTDRLGSQAAQDIRLHVLKSGDRYDMAAKKPIR